MVCFLFKSTCVMLTYAHGCSRMLTYADVRWRTLTCMLTCILTYSDVFWRMLTCPDVCWRMLAYADVCWRMRTYADVSWRMRTYADVCWREASAQHLVLPGVQYDQVFSDKIQVESCHEPLCSYTPGVFFYFFFKKSRNYKKSHQTFKTWIFFKT